jgi:hypothetical protein
MPARAMKGTGMSLEKRIQRLEAMNGHGTPTHEGPGVMLYWSEDVPAEADRRERSWADERAKVRCSCGMLNCPAPAWQEIRLVWLPHKRGAPDAP